MKKRPLDFRPATHELDKVLFPVKELDVFTRYYKTDKEQHSLFSDSNAYPLFKTDLKGNQYNKEINAEDYKALFNFKDEYILSIVTKNYQLVTNKEAIDLGKKAFMELFTSVKNENELIPYKIISTKKLTSCHIDLIHEKVVFDKWQQDTWLPFLRITNSYNRTHSLTFELGFVRKLCSNGFIFDKKAVTVKFDHMKSKIPPHFEVDVSALKQFELEFVNYLNNLNRFYVDEKYVFPLVLKAFNLQFRPVSEMKEPELDRFDRTRAIIYELTNHYYRELKPTAYAVLNVMTDFISHQADYNVIPLYQNHANNLYRKPSQWMTDFVNAIQLRDFSFDNYLGIYKSYLN